MFVTLALNKTPVTVQYDYGRHKNGQELDGVEVMYLAIVAVQIKQFLGQSYRWMDGQIDISVMPCPDVAFR